MPAASSQATTASMSPISPMPQLRDEGIENSGISAPARRDPGRGGVIGVPSRGREPQDPGRAVAKDVWQRQQADDHERLALKVEEIPGVREHPFAIEQVEDELFLGAR